MAEFTISKLADQDLESIYYYSVQTFGDEAAGRYLRDFHSRFALITDFPAIGTAARVGGTACLKFPSGSHIIFYQRTAAQILIGRVLHSAQDAARYRFD